MRNTWKRVIFTITAATLFLSGLFAAQALNSDFGRVAVTAISIPGGDKTLSGLLYQPNSASVDQPAPAVVLAHGIGGSKHWIGASAAGLCRILLGLVWSRAV
jgi:poly(3-hydroxybutyrate) depolymerase